jgi:cation diffusion facilitator CzcD-associated flavoprotein CzcO
MLPADWVSSSTRVRNLAIQLALWKASKRWPDAVKRLILAGVRVQVGPDVDMRHFTPTYNPWDERLCVVPNGDLFRVLRRGQASIVTDHIDRFTKTGILLKSGDEIEADIIVTATGLKVQLMGGITGDLDGEPIKVTDRLTYKAMMASDIPNFALLIGYVNASWTRKVDHVGEYLGRLLSEMDAKGMRVVTPRANGAAVADEPFIDMKSGYVQRGLDMMPLQGEHTPWRNSQNVLWDWLVLRFGAVDDGNLEFSAPADGSRGRRAPLPTPGNVVRLATRPVRQVLTRIAS